MNNQTASMTDQVWREKLNYTYEQSKMFEELYLKYEKENEELKAELAQLKGGNK